MVAALAGLGQSGCRFSWGYLLRFVAAPRDGLARLRNRAEKNFNVELVRVAFVDLPDLVESLVAYRRCALLKGFVLSLDDGPANRTLALLVTLQTNTHRHVEKHQGGWNPAFSCLGEQIPASLRRERGGIDYAQAVQLQPLV
jgi:hypothetical protein